MSRKTAFLPLDFILKRIHSFAGFGIALFLLFHLFVNGTASLFLKDRGAAFSGFVNQIHQLPGLIVVEMALIALPFLLHGILGVRYLFTGKMNSFLSDGSTPSLPRYSRNWAYSLQRITAWILLFAISFHVLQMRFLQSPEKIGSGSSEHWEWAASDLRGLDLVTQQMNLTIEKRGEQVIVHSKTGGPLYFLEVREVFASLPMVILYTLFVLSAAFHGFNGLWTFLITWGITVTPRSQNISRAIITPFMAIAMIFGLLAIFGLYFTFWIDL